MSASSVRDLARRHAAGELSLEDYRSKRHVLIDDIINGRQSLTYGEHRSVRLPRTYPSSRLVLLAGIAIVVVIIVTLTIWLTGTHTHAVPTVQNTAPVSQPNESQTSPGPLLVEGFLNSNNWSKTSIRSFIQQWNDLPQKEREIAKQNYRYPRLISELRQQIVSQQAMSGLTKNTDAAKAQLTSLQDMANMLGIGSDN